MGEESGVVVEPADDFDLGSIVEQGVAEVGLPQLIGAGAQLLPLLATRRTNLTKCH